MPIWMAGSRTLRYQPELARWIAGCGPALHTLVRDVTEGAMNTTMSPGATRPVETFVNQLSTWFLRRSRRRFWKSESDADKQAAYATLYEAAGHFEQTAGADHAFPGEETVPELGAALMTKVRPCSVHLANWPIYNASLIDENLNREMALVVKLASLGHAARNKANRKVRQPLGRSSVFRWAAGRETTVRKLMPTCWTTS